MKNVQKFSSELNAKLNDKYEISSYEVLKVLIAFVFHRMHHTHCITFELNLGLGRRSCTDIFRFESCLGWTNNLIVVQQVPQQLLQVSNTFLFFFYVLFLFIYIQICYDPIILPAVTVSFTL